MAEEQGSRRPPGPSGQSSSSKKGKSLSSASPGCPPFSGVMVVTQEPVEGQAVHAGRASRARAAAAGEHLANPPVEFPRPRINVSLELRLLHCAVAACYRPLKPPVFKCEAGHRLCGNCRGDGGVGEGHCRRCDRGAIFVHCGPDMDEVVGSARVPCPFEAYGCVSAIVYHDGAAHRSACAYAPCTCAVARCRYTASPPMLREHLASAHSWPEDSLPGYGRAIQLRVPTSESQPHRLLVVKGDKRRLFVLSVRARGAASWWAVSVACVRASGAAEAGPRYMCYLCAEAPAEPGMPASNGRCLIMEAEVASCEVPGGGAAVEERMALVVPPAMLMGPSKEIELGVRINLVVDPALASQMAAG
ncbi:hypothetical protein BAE44_0003754 [Dichanthelium oligosanthes]|uniref:SIAH-type domain-containing protein n=1 Tax=Dichanthelium oligosanthes TaxID=888268 RepID=A0A1E5WDB8_9POAL|nr:hypothetical protein BAE44_0003754 [Dichanthelium oligosanthes]